MSNLPKYDPNCWLAQHGTYTREGDMPACEGRLVRVHLIKQQVLRKALKCTGRDKRLWDDAVWVWGCGGFGYGNEGHHGMFDHDGKVEIARAALPEVLEVYAANNGLGWYLDRYFT